MYFSCSLVQIQSLEMSSLYEIVLVGNFSEWLNFGIIFIDINMSVKKFTENAKISERFEEYLIYIIQIEIYYLFN